MSKHTPGPWFIDGEDKAFVYALAPSGINSFWAHVESAGPARIDAAQKAANARLIAAAPELLEALTLMVRTHDEPAETLLQEAKEQKWLEKARAAIAKATGEK